MRTLIVDDEPDMRSLAARILSRRGAVCQMAGSAEEALDRCAHDAFDVVVIDIRLPGLDGLELAHRLNASVPDTSLVMMTGWADAGAVIDAMQAGAADYVVKPFAPEQLERAFDRAVDRRRVRLDASRAGGLRRAIEERTLEVRLLLSDAGGGSAASLAAAYHAALAVRDAGSAAHASRVAALARELGARLGLAGEALERLAQAAILHDIGKAVLPETVLSKPEGLSADDVRLVRRFPELGYEVVRQVPALERHAPILLGQLEHYDGSGSPLGLRGSHIPVEARIIAVANALDVMTHPRSWKALLPVIEAVREIEGCAGRQFDPEIVTALMAHFDVEPTAHEWLAEDGS